MTLRQEIAQLIAGGQQMHGDELTRLSNKYGVDPYELYFIWKDVEQGQLGREVDDGK